MVLFTIEGCCRPWASGQGLEHSREGTSAARLNKRGGAELNKKGIRMKMSCTSVRYCVALLLASGGTALTATGVRAADAPPLQIPTCDKKIGTLAVTEPQNQWWTALNLESPAALI